MLLAVAVTVAFYACGPSAEEKAKRDQEIKDSIAAVEKAKQDSIDAAAAAAAEAAAKAEQARMDSLRQDSIMKAEEAAKKPGVKKKAEPKAGSGKDNPAPSGNVKAGQGKG